MNCEPTFRIQYDFLAAFIDTITTCNITYKAIITGTGEPATNINAGRIFGTWVEQTLVNIETSLTVSIVPSVPIFTVTVV